MASTVQDAQMLSSLQELGLERVELYPLSGEATRVGRKAWKVVWATPAMGTLVSITAVSSSRDRAEGAIERAFSEMERLLGILTRYDRSSAVGVLNQEGQLRGAPPELLTLVERSLQYHDLSRGAFDISVLPLLDLFDDGSGSEASGGPSESALREALARVGCADLELRGDSVRFMREGMAITLDGIAKGFIVDRMAKTLERCRIRNYLINAGGDIRAAGRKEARRLWTVAVQDPAKRGDFPDIIELKNAAVATSGSYEKYFDAGRLYHHIVSSDSGRSPDHNTSVSVVAPSAMAADALATSLFAMPPGVATRWVDSLRGCECLVIDKDGTQHRSRRWKSAAS